jgi:hypothetical protein
MNFEAFGRRKAEKCGNLCSARRYDQGNESRLTPQRPQDVEQVFGIPSGALTAAFDRSFVDALAHQVEGEVANHGHVLGAMTGAQA